MVLSVGRAGNPSKALSFHSGIGLLEKASSPLSRHLFKTAHVYADTQQSPVQVCDDCLHLFVPPLSQNVALHFAALSYQLIFCRMPFILSVQSAILHSGFLQESDKGKYTPSFAPGPKSHLPLRSLLESIHSATNPSFSLACE